MPAAVYAESLLHLAAYHSQLIRWEMAEAGAVAGLTPPLSKKVSDERKERRRGGKKQAGRPEKQRAAARDLLSAHEAFGTIVKDIIKDAILRSKNPMYLALSLFLVPCDFF
jgi:hypothetical protein